MAGSRFNHRHHFRPHCFFIPRMRPWLLACLISVWMMIPAWGHAQTYNVGDLLQNWAPLEFQTWLSGDTITVATVHLDGRPIFEVGVPRQETVSVELTAAQRAQQIQRQLQVIAQTDYTESSLNVVWRLDEPSKQPVIYVNDQFLMTVTLADARLGDLNNLEIRADVLTKAIRRALVTYKAERQPAFLQQQAQKTVALLLVVLLSVYICKRLRYRLRQRQQRLANPPFPPPGEPATTALRKEVNKKEQKDVLDLLRFLLKITQFVLLLGGLWIVLGWFPLTRWLQV